MGRGKRKCSEGKPNTMAEVKLVATSALSTPIKIKDNTAIEFEDFRVTGWIKEGELGRAKISVGEVDRFSALRASLHGESLNEGDKMTRLFVKGKLVMSDTKDEYYDHLDPIRHAKGRVLIHGLGLGYFLKAILAKPEVEHVDVVEFEEDVVALVGPYFKDDPRVHIHVGDAYTFKFPPGTKWDMAWHDIWADKCSDDLEGHAKLNRRYGRSVSWQGCWAHEEILDQQRRYLRSGW